MKTTDHPPTSPLRLSIACAAFIAACSTPSARPPATPAPIANAPPPWRGAAICRSRLAPDVLATLEAHARDGTSTCEERARLAAHYFDAQLEIYDHWQPQLDEHFVWLADHCPDTNQTCLLSLMVPSVALTAAWKARADAHPTSAIIRDNADAAAWQAKRDAESRDQPRLLQSLAEHADDAFDTGNTRSAEAYAIELLLRTSLAPKPRDLGDLIRNAHALLGRIAMRAGDTATTAHHLRVIARTEGGTPIMLPSPVWGLAGDLLDAGQQEVVIEYLELSKREWPHQTNMLDDWEREIHDGKPSTFPGGR